MDVKELLTVEKPAPSKLEKEQQTYDKAYSKLVLIMILSSIFVTLQFIGGWIANSIAIMADTAHLATDMLGFVMSMYALKVSLRPASNSLTYGWHRAEIIGTMSSVLFLCAITIWLVCEAIKRIITPQEVQGFEMLMTALMAFGFNLV